FVAAGAVGFYAGYSAGRGNLDEMKAYVSNAQAVIPSGNGSVVSLKPVLDDLQNLSKRVEALTAAKASAAADSDSGARLVLDEIKGLSSQLDGLRQNASKPLVASCTPIDRPSAAPPTPDYTDTLQDIREQVRALAAKVEKQEPKAPKALMDDIRGLGASIQAQEPDLRRALGEEVRSAVASLQNAEPKAPKAILDELRSLNSSIQAQEPAMRRAVSEEMRSVAASLQNAELKVPKAILDEIRSIAANVKPQEARPQTTQASVADQIKVLQASVEALKAKLSEERGRADSAASADIAQLHQLVASASDQFARCQTQLASLGAPGSGAAAQQAAAPAATPTPAAITVSQEKKTEPAAVVFYDNVMLKKDQEKQYDEIGVRLALQSIGSRQVHVAVNRQPFGLSFGERKVFRSQDVECEINLMETNLKESQARISISCKR
ncbi:MAG TPA: hypothetical protein VEK14_07050, partial [Rhodomicrobium sp.]|nr:hypothetical protein [Rhodomicrobium sp.]